MSRSETKVEYEYIDTKYSSGDSNKMTKQLYQEENNNEVDELSKEFSEMGCIVDAVKRPPNICVEHCIYESESDNETHTQSQTCHNDNDDNYSDEFEDDKSDAEDIEVQNISAVSNGKADHVARAQPSKSSVKLAKSQSSVSSNKPPSISGRSTGYGSISVPTTRRVNMSFTNERLREIERHNHILLNKILSARNNRKCTVPREPPKRPVPPAAVHRKLQQRKIDHDNMILLKKIQRAKSSACSIRR